MVLISFQVEPIRHVRAGVIENDKSEMTNCIWRAKNWMRIERKYSERAHSMVSETLWRFSSLFFICVSRASLCSESSPYLHLLWPLRRLVRHRDLLWTAASSTTAVKTTCETRLYATTIIFYSRRNTLFQRGPNLTWCSAIYAIALRNGAYATSQSVSINNILLFINSIIH